MPTQMAEVGLTDPLEIHETFGKPAARDVDTTDPERNAVVRGIVVAVLLSIPFWALSGFALYMLL